MKTRVETVQDKCPRLQRPGVSRWSWELWHGRQAGSDGRPVTVSRPRTKLTASDGRPSQEHHFRTAPGPHRTRQSCSDPVCDRPSASRSIPSRPAKTAPLEAVLTGRNRPVRARTVMNRTVANRAGTALTGAVRTGRESESRAHVRPQTDRWQHGPGRAGSVPHRNRSRRRTPCPSRARSRTLPLDTSQHTDNSLYL